MLSWSWRQTYYGRWQNGFLKCLYFNRKKIVHCMKSLVTSQTEIKIKQWYFIPSSHLSLTSTEGLVSFRWRTTTVAIICSQSALSLYWIFWCRWMYRRLWGPVGFIPGYWKTVCDGIAGPHYLSTVLGIWRGLSQQETSKYYSYFQEGYERRCW